MTTTTTTVRNAAEAFIDACHAAFVEDLASSMTCTEVDALADLYLALGQDPFFLLRSHAESDEPEDDHYDLIPEEER